MSSLQAALADPSSAEPSLPHEGRPAAPLLVFADDWGRHPSSCQHLIRQLLGRHQVAWVNTIGMRTPQLDWATMSRGFEKLRHWARPRPKTGGTEPLPENLRVVNPRMWPWFGSRPSRWLNRALLGRQLTSVIRQMPAEPVAVTTLPITADLIGALPVRRWVYYCVDDFSQWPGLDQGTLQRLDEELVKKVDVAVAVSETLQDRIRSFGRESHLLTHGVDVEFWRGGQGEAVPQLDGLPRPLVVFWGVVDRRMDLAFLHRLADDMKEGTIAVIGPWNDADPALVRPGKIVHLPPLAFAQLPRVAREASVLVMPYADLPVTRAIQPLKMKEYLATGRPVVMRDLPATRPWSDCLDLARTPEEFSAAVLRRLAEGVSPEQTQARESRLAGESWAAKALDLERWALFP